MSKVRAYRFGSSTLALLAMSAMGTVHAQDQSNPDPSDIKKMNEIVVIGSYLDRKSIDTPAPVLVIDSGDIENSGVNTITDVARNLSINTGSQFNTDERTQGGSTGTSNFNLRGLGVGSTLVLVNGRRRANSLAVTNNAVSFVDINLLTPLNMVERVEVLKDGAASLYGSDAVAGVVNFVTKREFDGFELEANYRFADKASVTRDIELSGLFGHRDDNFGIIIAANYLDRSLLTADEIGFGQGSSFSTLGSPGAYQPAFKPFTGPGVPLTNRPTVVVGAPAADPGCVQNGGTITPSGSTATFCGFSQDPFLTLVADEERIQAAVSIYYDFSDDTRFTLDTNFADNESFRIVSPSFPLVSFPFVPQSNPGFVPGSAPGQVVGALNALQLPPTFTKGALLFGRAVPTSGAGRKNTFHHQSFSTTANLQGQLSSNWNYDLAASYSRLKTETNIEDELRDRFIAALEGRGGPNNNQFFNPFASGINAAPGSPFYNDPAVIADFTSAQISNAKADFVVLDALITGRPFALGGRDVGVALGAQWRRDKRSYDFNQETNDNRLLFLYGRPDAKFSNSVTALFTELSWPLTERLELQTALRFEHHGGSIGSSVDPKVAALWEVNDFLSVRGSFSTAFRAPQFLQNEAASSITSLERVTDPNNPTARADFVPVIRTGNPDLKPEQSESWNIGVTVRPTNNLTFRTDYWRFDIRDLVVGQTAQGLADSNNPDNIIRVSGTNSIARLVGTFFNASDLKTSGLDFELIYRGDLGNLGDLRVDLSATKVLTYQFRTEAGGPLVERLGRRNFATIASPTPAWRANMAINWSLNGHSLTSTIHYIDSYLNDEPLVRIPALPAEKISSWTTVDMQYSIDLAEAFDLGFGKGTKFTAGAINLFDKAPPLARTDSGLPYDSRVHDPRGRILYVGLKQSL